MQWLQNFIEQIRNSEEDVKSMWIYGFAGASLVIMLGLWIGYMNVSVPDIALPQERLEEIAKLEPPPEPTTTDVFVAGFTSIVRAAGISLSQTIGFLKEKVLGKPRTTIITP